MAPGMIFALTFMAMVMSVPIVAILTAHMRSVMELKLKHRRETAPEPKAIEALRREIAELRDTTTRFDMSFDTALQRIEQRLGAVEARADSPVAEAVEIGRQG